MACFSTLLGCVGNVLHGLTCKLHPSAVAVLFLLHTSMHTPPQQQTRSGRRNRRAGSEPAPVIHHFKRVTGPLTAPASKSHPHQLSGLWKGLYGPHGCEMVAVSYDFSGRAAHIVARKLTGVRRGNVGTRGGCVRCVHACVYVLWVRYLVSRAFSYVCHIWPRRCRP